MLSFQNIVLSIHTHPIRWSLFKFVYVCHRRSMQQDNIINWDLRQWGEGGGVVSNTEIRLLMKFFYWYSCIPQGGLSWIHTPSFLLITQLYTDVYPFSDTCVLLLWVYCFSPLCSAYSARLWFASFTRIFYYLAYIPWYNMITLIYFLWSTLSIKISFCHSILPYQIFLFHFAFSAHIWYSLLTQMFLLYYTPLHSALFSLICYAFIYPFQTDLSASVCLIWLNPSTLIAPFQYTHYELIFPIIYDWYTLLVPPLSALITMLRWYPLCCLLSILIIWFSITYH